MDGSRTHRGPQRDPPPVLKTEEPTGTQPLPCYDKDTLSKIEMQDSHEEKLIRVAVFICIADGL